MSWKLYLKLRQLFLYLPRNRCSQARGSDAWPFRVRCGTSRFECARNFHSKIFIAPNNSRPRTALLRADIYFFPFIIVTQGHFYLSAVCRRGIRVNYAQRRGSGTDRDLLRDWRSSVGRMTSRYFIYGDNEDVALLSFRPVPPSYVAVTY